LPRDRGGAEVALVAVQIEAAETVFWTPELQDRVKGDNLGNMVAL
jgi:hypothetical protein